jgi:hypothetical protein
VTEHLIQISSNPLVPLYTLQALTYAIAAVLSRHAVTATSSPVTRFRRSSIPALPFATSCIWFE